MGAKYLDERVRTAVRMSVCLRISQKRHIHTSQNFLYLLHVAVAPSSSDDNAMHYVLPVLWMTPSLPMIGEAKATLTGYTLKGTHQWAEPSGVYDCVVRTQVTLRTFG